MVIDGPAPRVMLVKKTVRGCDTAGPAIDDWMLRTSAGSSSLTATLVPHSAQHEYNLSDPKYSSFYIFDSAYSKCSFRIGIIQFAEVVSSLFSSTTSWSKQQLRYSFTHYSKIHPSYFHDYLLQFIG
jgi:hypothetical protein